MLCPVRTRQPQGVDLTLRGKVDSVVCWFCFGLCVRAWPLHSEQEKDVKLWKGKMTVPANATQARSSPKAEAFRFISMALVKIWLSLEVWEWTFTKSCPAAKQKQCAGWNSRFMFFEHQLWGFFYSACCSPHPHGPGSPWAFPGAVESCRATHGEKPGIPPGRHRECPSDHHRHLGTPQGRKERRSGQGRLAADTSLRTVLLGE